MTETPLWQTWGFWRRVLLFTAGVLTLAGQMLSVTSEQAKWLAFGVAVVNLAISLLTDAAVARVTRLAVR